MKNIKYLLASLFIFLYNIAVFGQDPDDEGWADDTTIPDVPQTPGPIGEGGRKTPIDMYEWVLVLVAVSLIVGYYLYKKNRRLSYLK